MQKREASFVIASSLACGNQEIISLGRNSLMQQRREYITWSRYMTVDAAAVIRQMQIFTSEEQSLQGFDRTPTHTSVCILNPQMQIEFHEFIRIIMHLSSIHDWTRILTAYCHSFVKCWLYYRGTSCIIGIYLIM